MFYLKIFEIVKFSTFVLCQSNENEGDTHSIQRLGNYQDQEYEPTFTFGPSDSEDEGLESQVNLQPRDSSEIENDNTNQQDLDILEITHNSQNDVIVRPRNVSPSLHRSRRVNDLSNCIGENPTNSRNSPSNNENKTANTNSDNELNDEIKGGCGKWFIIWMQRLGCIILPEND